MKVESIAECCNTFDLHLAIISLEKTIFGLLETGRFTQVLLYCYTPILHILTTFHPIEGGLKRLSL